MDKYTVLSFIGAINDADTDKLYELMSEDHLFIDAHGKRVNGRKEMRGCWRDYFTIFPDYLIEVDEIFREGPRFCVLGYAGATYKGLKDETGRYRWRVPAAWKAVVTDGKVSHWQVYADNIQVVEIIQRVGDKQFW